MRIRVFFLLIISCFLLPNTISAQENAAVPARTPEQEASTQTERMQKELNLTNAQARSVYEINLRHARERKVSNSRSQALERIKTKEEEIRQVLSRDQYSRLQNMRYDRGTVNAPSTDRPNSERTINTQLRTRPVTPSSGNQAVTPGRNIPRNENLNPRNENNSRYASPVNPNNDQNASRRTVPATTVNPNSRYSTPQNDNNTRYSVPQNPSSTYRNSRSGTASPPTRQTQPSSSGSSSQPAQPSRSSGGSSGSSSQRR